MEYAHQQDVDEVMTEVGQVESRVLGYFSESELIPFLGIPQFDQSPQIPFVKLEVSYNPKTLELMEPTIVAGEVSDQMSRILGSQEDYSEGVLQWLMSYPIAPSTVDGLQYYLDNPTIYVVQKDADFVAGTFHPEAASAYRIYRIGQISGNQALYDTSGNLIGTSPDFVSPTASLGGHLITDVLLPAGFAAFFMEANQTSW